MRFDVGVEDTRDWYLFHFPSSFAALALRNVSVFANMLNITPKYLSKCVKDESGRSPLDLIHETTAGTIRQQLRYSNKTVKEICTELDFPKKGIIHIF